MRIIGRLCDRVDTVEGREGFKELYDTDPFEFIFDRQLFHSSNLSEKEYKYLVFLESDADVRQVFYLEPGEHLTVYNDIDDEIFNTDSMAFFELIRDCSRIALFCTEHSPWSFKLNHESYVEEMDTTAEEILEKIHDYCKDMNLEQLATIENTLIVRAL